MLWKISILYSMSYIFMVLWDFCQWMCITWKSLGLIPFDNVVIHDILLLITLVVTDKPKTHIL